MDYYKAVIARRSQLLAAQYEKLVARNSGPDPWAYDEVTGMGVEGDEYVPYPGYCGRSRYED
jgi:hypothetical protein